MKTFKEVRSELINKSNTVTTREALYCLIAFSFPFSVLAINIAIALLCLILIIDLKRKQHSIKYDASTLILPSLFLIYALSLLYSQDTTAGLRKLETKFSLLILPAVICAYYISSGTIQKIKIFFLAGITTASLICIINAFYVGLSRTGQLSILENQYFYDRDFFVSTIGLQPPYFGLYLSAALLFLLSIATTIKLNISRRIILTSAFLILFGTLLLVHARMALLSFILLLILWMLYVLIAKKKFLFLLFSFFTLAVAISFIVSTPFLNSRIIEVLNTPLREPAPGENNSVSLRYGQIYCSLQILEQYPLTGVGVGDTQEKLNECYKSRNYHPSFVEEKLNSHNQYLEVGISSGIIGLLMLIFIYSRLFYIFYIKGNKGALFFVALIALTSMTETVLNTFKGVVLFSFFCSVFLACISKKGETQHRL